MIGHWEGEIVSSKFETPILLDWFEGKILLSLPAFGIYGISGIYREYFDHRVSIYFSQEHPIAVNLIVDQSGNKIRGTVSQDENTFDLFCSKVLMQSIDCIGNSKYEYYLNILKMSSLTLEEYNDITSKIIYKEISDVIKNKILNFYNFTSLKHGSVDEILEITKIIHGKFKHTPNFAPQYKINTLSIIQHSPEQINCRTFAILFNELALAAGYKSRYVTCLPYKDWENDCHVINEVFVERTNKWVAVDANMGTLIKNENGSYLNIYEYRKALSAREICRVLATAAYNGEEVTSDDYNSYMVKNMYQFQYKAVYGFNTENEKTIKTKINICDW